MLRAVPATCCLAPSGSLAFRSGILASAISATWAQVIEPASSRPGFCDAFSSPAAWRIRNEVGGVLVTKVNDRSS